MKNDDTQNPHWAKRVLALVVAYENNSLLFVYYVYYTFLPYNIKR
jgi:hypothetical protein